MLVRIEQIRGTDTVLIIDEIGRYLGQMYFADFSDCIIENLDPVEEDDYLFWQVDKNELNKFFKNVK